MYCRLSHDVVTLSCRSRRFDWLRSTIYITIVGCDWCISILTVPARSCSLSGPLLYHSPVVFIFYFFYHGNPRFGNFNSTIPVDVIRVKSYVESSLDPTGVPVRVSIDKLYLVPKWIMAGLVGVFGNGGGLGTGESHIPVVLFDSFMHRSPSFPDVDFTAFTAGPAQQDFEWGGLKDKQVKISQLGGSGGMPPPGKFLPILTPLKCRI